MNGKAARLRETWILEDPSGHEVARNKEKMHFGELRRRVIRSG